MHPRSCFSRLIFCAALAVSAGFLPGCGNVFVTKHKVLVDAIAVPGAPKPSGQSYRLVAKKAMVSNTQMQVMVIKACIDAALLNVGMFDAPPNVPPDVFIEVSYGMDMGPRVDPASRETFLQLSGRANPERSLEKPTGQEIWDVRVGVMGIAGRPESAMPLLASVLVGYIGQDTKAEARIEIPQNAPQIASVRDTAIKTLETKAAPPPVTGAAPTGPADAAVEGAAPGVKGPASGPGGTTPAPAQTSAPTSSGGGSTNAGASTGSTPPTTK